MLAGAAIGGTLGYAWGGHGGGWGCGSGWVEKFYKFL